MSTFCFCWVYIERLLIFSQFFPSENFENIGFWQSIIALNWYYGKEGLRFPFSLMDRLNGTEYVVFKFCRFSIFLKEPFFQILIQWCWRLAFIYSIFGPCLRGFQPGHAQATYNKVRVPCDEAHFVCGMATCRQWELLKWIANDKRYNYMMPIEPIKRPLQSSHVGGPKLRLAPSSTLFITQTKKICLLILGPSIILD